MLPPQYQANVPPNTWRLVGDRDPRDTAYIPMPPGVAAELMEWLRPSPEQQARNRIEAEAYAAERKAKFEAEAEVYRARHAALLVQRADSPILLALLQDHAPQVKDEWIECDGCPTYEDDHPYEGLTEVHHEWPCPTWSLIERAT